MASDDLLTVVMSDEKELAKSNCEALNNLSANEVRQIRRLQAWPPSRFEKVCTMRNVWHYCLMEKSPNGDSRSSLAGQILLGDSNELLNFLPRYNRCLVRKTSQATYVGKEIPTTIRGTVDVDSRIVNTTVMNMNSDSMSKGLTSSSEAFPTSCPSSNIFVTFVILSTTENPFET
ncbi:hypothetical protein V6N13_042498 [Hibiscus sabdariffa]